MIPKESAILISGAMGLVGTALINELNAQGYNNLILCSRTSHDLRDWHAVKTLFEQTKPDVVFHLAAAVYGIGGNLAHRGSVFFDNVMMNTHIIEASRLVKVKKVIAMGTIAAYPDPKQTPVIEKMIWEGPPHGSESSYGHAKRAMLAQLEAYSEQYGLDYAYIISTNLYGMNDKFDPQFGHVLPSLIRKFHEAKHSNSTVSVWSDGSAARDFLYSKDMANALCLIMNQYSGAINVGSGVKTTIREAVDVLSQYFCMEDRVEWDISKPKGRNFYEMDLSKLHGLGFQPAYSMNQGLTETLNWYTQQHELNTIRK